MPYFGTCGSKITLEKENFASEILSEILGNIQIRIPILEVGDPIILKIIPWSDATGIFIFDRHILIEQSL